MFVCIVQYFIFDYALINCRNPAGVARIIKNWGWPKWMSGAKDQQNIFFWFLPRDAMHKRGLCCSPVCPSVCPSVCHVDALCPDGWR